MAADTEPPTDGPEPTLPRVTSELIAPLPVPVRRHLAYAGVVGQVVPSSVHLRQEGELLARPNSRWLPFAAEQQYTTALPSFSWVARMTGFPVVTTRAHDELTTGGKGRMRVWPVPFWKAVDATGPEMDQGAVTRFMNEMMWFPAAYVLPYLRWEEVDEHTAVMHAEIGGVSAAATLEFGSDGSLTDFTTNRYRTAGKNRWDLCRWSTPLARSELIGGVRVPVEGEGVWHLDDGDFTYIRLRITGLAYL
jgi:hypothetical protein